MAYRATDMPFEVTRRIGLAYSALLRELRFMELEVVSDRGETARAEFAQEVENQLGPAIREIYELNRDS